MEGINPNLPLDVREYIAEDLEQAKQFAVPKRQYLVQASLADAIAKLRMP
jgi:hypothetical protein